MLNAHTENSDGKNIALIFCKDNSGCSHVRLRYNSEYINGHNMGVYPIVLPFPTFDPGYLARTKALIFQRPISPMDIQIITRYKELQPRFNYKIVAEFDDLVFLTGEGKDDAVPSYNPGHDGFMSNIGQIMDVMKTILPMVDQVICSTPYLKKMVEKVFGHNNVKVVKNVVPRYLWNFERKKPIEEDLKKPVVIYSGSPTHFRTPIPTLKPGQNPNFPNGHPGQPGDKGDWNTALCDWVIKNVKEDKIDFVVVGSLPFFFEPIKNKITYVPWSDSHTFPRKFMELHADFSIASIVDNPFNRCKSSLRFTEACACGCVFIGDVFKANDDSPYREIYPECKFFDTSSVDEIDTMFWKLCKKDKYNEVLNWQYDFINNSECWLESDGHINEMLCIFDTKSPNII